DFFCGRKQRIRPRLLGSISLGSPLTGRLGSAGAVGRSRLLDRCISHRDAPRLTRLSDFSQPRVLGQRTRDLVHQMRPEIARIVDRLDDRDLLIERIARRFSSRFGVQNGTVLRRILYGLRLPRIQICSSRRLADEHQNDKSTRRAGCGYRAKHILVGHLFGEPGEPRWRLEVEFKLRGAAVFARFFFLPSPGRRLISIIVSFSDQFLRRARPIESIRRGATSSVTSDSRAPSLTDIVARGFASSTGFFSRCPSASVRPGVREPPPQVYTAFICPSPLSDVDKNAIARSRPVAISSVR